MAPKPSKPPPHPTRPETHEPPCEFTHPCTTSTGSGSSSTSGGSTPSNHPRKLISHIFGRNKTATKLFPPHVWVHYCRKHYQRARYRARAWPFTQCDLLLDSLARMEAWGGVESFELGLRRREVERLSSQPSFSSAKGEREGEGERGGERGEGLRGGRLRRGGCASASASASGDDDEEEEEEGDDGEEEEGESDDGGKRKGGRRRRRRPRIRASPVPEWLRRETGAGKSFGEIRAIVARIRADLTEQHRQAQKAKGKSKEQVLFPDIEILPTFRGWVLEKADGGREGKKMSRVSRKGAVQKIRG